MNLGTQNRKIIWLTGIPNSGKTTLGKALKDYFLESGREKVYWVDSDNLRKKCPNLGYTHKDRLALFANLGCNIKEKLKSFDTIIVSATANLLMYRKLVRDMLVAEVCFFEVFVDCPVKICATQRDEKKSIYSLAKRDRWKLPIYIEEKFDWIRNFRSCREYVRTNFEYYDFYEPPTGRFLHVRSDKLSLESQVREIITHMGE